MAPRRSWGVSQVWVVRNIWKNVRIQMRSQPLEGGGHGPRAQLEESLTEDDAGTDQGHTTRDDGDHDSQDQGGGQLTVGGRAGWSCRRTDRII